MTRKASLLGLAGAFLLQAALLGWMIADRALLLARGTEIRLAVDPVDPRDLFRGDYVVLSYPISRLRTDQLEGADEFKIDQTVYVSLRSDGSTWKAVAAHPSRPDGGLVLKGKVTNEIRHGSSACPTPCRVYDVAYNLEEFFVPEGQGRDIEQLRNAQRVEVDVAVGSDGRAALKRLLVDGAVRYQDTLF